MAGKILMFSGQKHWQSKNKFFSPPTENEGGIPLPKQLLRQRGLLVCPLVHFSIAAS